MDGEPRFNVLLAFGRPGDLLMSCGSVVLLSWALLIGGMMVLVFSVCSVCLCYVKW